MLDPKQQAKYNELNDLLKESSSREEIQKYSNEIMELFDETDINVSTKNDSFSEVDRDLYKEYKEKMLEAETTADIHYYEEKIMELFNNH
ncbi:hypothetical protein [Lentibacillus sediminis]|uniref:hypothetical protein n=1 Tax=Lentibacillus sediminis TaxID=1940529 RepID=UPI000C1BFEDF|nr:hypothetical protein [Lentibacillus sediminis]